MIDFIKMVHTCSDITEFVDKHRDQMTCRVNFGTGEMIPPFEFKYKQYTITIRSNTEKGVHFIEVTGSLHKSHFDGPNYQRFNFDCLQYEIDYLSSYLGVSPDQLRVQNLEIGVNVETNFRPFKYLKNNLLLYKTKEFKPYDYGVDAKELGFYCPGTPIIKIYDKGKQYDLPGNLMRFEVRYKKSQPLNKMGIYTLADLQDRSMVQSLGQLLIKTWESVLLYESDLDLNKSKLTSGEKKFYRESAHTKNWLKWKRQQKSRSGYYNLRQRFIDIITSYGTNEHRIVAGLIRSEVEECTKIRDENGADLYISTHKLKCSSVHHSEDSQTPVQEGQLSPTSEDASNSSLDSI